MTSDPSSTTKPSSDQNESRPGFQNRKGRPDRLRRFEQEPDGTLDIHGGDLAVFRLAETCRLIDARQLYLFLSTQRPLNRDTFRRRLKQLYRRDYLDRPRQQLGRRFLNGLPSRDYVYVLSTKGYAALHPNKPLPDFRATKRIQARAIDHRIGVTEAVLTFTAAARRHDYGLRFLDAEELRAQFPTLPTHLDVHETYEGKKRSGAVQLFTRTTPRVPIYPDAVFILSDADADSANTFYYFLEVDRGTEPIDDRTDHGYQRASIRRKLLAYTALHAGGFHKRAGIPRFNVLLITTSPTRVDTMRALAREIDPKRIGSRLFLFSTVEHVTLNHPERTLAEPIWHTPREDDPPLALLH